MLPGSVGERGGNPEAVGGDRQPATPDRRGGPPRRGLDFSLTQSLPSPPSDPLSASHKASHKHQHVQIRSFQRISLR